MASGTEAPKKRGRPALPAEKGKRYAIGIRTTKNLRDLLQRAADSSGRSLAQEIELRLERSFDRSQTAAELIVTAFGNPRLADFFQGLAAVGRAQAFIHGSIGVDPHWFDNPLVLEPVFEEWKKILDKTVDKRLEEAHEYEALAERKTRTGAPRRRK